jgi:hypothetical protein
LNQKQKEAPAIVGAFVVFEEERNLLILAILCASHLE